MSLEKATGWVYCCGMARRPAVGVTHVSNLLKEIWDSDAPCSERPWRASHLVLTWWRSALLEQEQAERRDDDER